MGKTNGLPGAFTVLLAIVLFFLFPALFLAKAIFAIVASLPVTLQVFDSFLAGILIPASIFCGRELLKKKVGALAVIEIFFFIAIGIAALRTILAFFIFDLNFTSRVTLGVAESVIFIIMAVVFIALARLLRRGGDGAGAFRFKKIPPFLENILLILLAALLFALSFPNFINEWGFGLLAFIALLPIFIVISRARWFSVFLYGILFSLVAYALFNFWLALFSPVALTVVLSIRALYAVPLFLLLKLADSLFPRFGFLVQSLVWVGFEFISTQGFLAYSYGILGYSQYLFIPLLQIAAIFSVWGLSFIVVVPSAFLGSALKQGIKQTRLFVKKNVIVCSIYGVLFVGALLYGFLSQTDTEKMPHLNVACIQPNIDPWKGGDPVYESSLGVLMRLSREALKEKPDLVVWPETALVPSLRLHSQMRFDQERYNRVIRPFLEFMDSQEIPYLVGNNDREIAGKDARGGYLITDYNSAILLEKREIKGVYRKTHLVPFTEYFPYKDVFPGIEQWLRNADTHFYEPGKGEDAERIFYVNNTPFAAPICFEDTFGEISRKFTRNGAGLLINLTNDAWSHSVAAEMQHMAVAVMRAVETRRTLVRSTTSGVTCIIDPQGRIIRRIPPFQEGFMVGEAPLNRAGPSLAVLWGDWFGFLLAVLALVSLSAGLIIRIVKIRRKGN